MAARVVLTALWDNRGKVLVLVLLVYASCTIPFEELDHEYGGTIVDAKTGDPIEGAVMVVSWITCGYLAMDSCGGVHSPLEAVSGPDGRISMDGTPWPVWNPLSYLFYIPRIRVLAAGYVPFTSSLYIDPSFEGLDGVSFVEAIRRKPRIALLRPEYLDGWRTEGETLRKKYRGLVVNPPHPLGVQQVRKLPHLRRVVNLYRAEFGLPPV